MHLAQGLMGNLPKLTEAAAFVFSDIFKLFSENSAPFLSFAPESLKPSTYGFGSVADQAPTGGLRVGRAVYTDADLCQ